MMLRGNFLVDFLTRCLSVGKSMEVSRSYHTCPDLCSFMPSIICFMKLGVVLKIVKVFDELSPLVMCGNPNRASIPETMFSYVPMMCGNPNRANIPETMFHLCHFQHDRRQVLSLFMNMRDFVTECRLK